MIITAAMCQEPCPGPAGSHPELLPFPSHITKHYRCGHMAHTGHLQVPESFGAGTQPSGPGRPAQLTDPFLTPMLICCPCLGPGPELGTCCHLC